MGVSQGKHTNNIKNQDHSSPKNYQTWASKAVQRLRTLSALPGDPGFSSQHHMTVYRNMQFQFQGIQYSLLASMSTMHACGAHTYIQENPYAHKN